MTKEQKLALIQKIEEKVAGKYKKMMFAGIAVALVVGIVLGMVSCMTGIVDPNMFAEPTPVPTAVPTPEPTPEPLYYPGDKQLPIADGEVYTFDTEISSTGTPRYVAGAEDTYMTANVSIAAARLMTPTYFEETYGKQYKLTGTEAGVQIDIKLNNVSGTEVAFVPQNALVITLESESGVVEGGFQLIDTEIEGSHEVPVNPGESMTYYKRFTWNNNEPMKYLVVQYYFGGVSEKVYFALAEDAIVTDLMKTEDEIAADEAAAAQSGEENVADTSDAVTPEMTANPAYVELAQGKRNKSVHVKTTQQRLIDLGYMEGKADGDFGGKTTTAVKAAQAAIGMEETGVADPLFLTILFSDQMPKAGAQPAPTAEPSVTVEVDPTEEPVEEAAEAEIAE